MFNVVTLVSLLLSCHFLLRVLRPAGIAERVLIFFCLFTAHVAALGYLLSLADRLDDVRYWSALALLSSFIAAAIFWRTAAAPFFAPPRAGFAGLIHAASSARNWYATDLSPFERAVLGPLMLTVLLLGLANLAVAVFTAPHVWDAMTYHLARVAYYLQHHNLDYFDANYWAQIVHPKNSSLLFLFTYLVTGGNENLTQLVQFIAYWVAVCSVYAIARKAGNDRAQSLFAALVSALLVAWLMQAATTQNDLILTAYFGATVYFLFAFRPAQQWKYLALAGLGIGLAIGTKASSLLPLLSVGWLAVYLILFQSGVDWPQRLRNFAVWAAASVLACCLFALPAGYLDNYRHFGNPVGPLATRTEHSFEGKPVDYILQNGTKNLARFGLDFLSLDGIPPIGAVRDMQEMIRALPVAIAHRLGMNLEQTEATRQPFDIAKMPTSDEIDSYWGILGFGLIWPMVLLSAGGAVRRMEPRMLAAAAILFLLCQAYAGPYDPWRGRYFTIAAIFAVPVIGVCLRAKNRWLRAYLLLIVLAGCLSAMFAVVLRYNSFLVSFDYRNEHFKSVFAMDRMEQLTRNRPDYYAPLKRFDELVPSHAVVAAFLDEDSYEYPLFGAHLTRTLIPLNAFDQGRRPIPASAGYLLYGEKFPCPDSADIYLGADWHLRRLTETNRLCP